MAEKKLEEMTFEELVQAKKDLNNALHIEKNMIISWLIQVQTQENQYQKEINDIESEISLRIFNKQTSLKISTENIKTDDSEDIK